MFRLIWTSVLTNVVQVWGVYRTAQKTDTIIDSVKIPVGTRVFASIKEANVDPFDIPFYLMLNKFQASSQSPILGTGEHG